MNGQPVRRFGIDYPSQSALARALGVSHQTIAFHLNNGSLDRAGARDGKRVHQRKRKPVTLAKPEATA